MAIGVIIGLKIVKLCAQIAMLGRLGRIVKVRISADSHLQLFTVKYFHVGTNFPDT